MIPKIIHYCWFGGGEIPEKDKKCIESWKKYCPDYKIIRWDESNYDVTKYAYMKEAYDAKKWGFVPDIARLDIIYQNGGIYLDTDVEIVRNLDDLLKNEAYMGFESESAINPGLGFGAEKNSPIINELLHAIYDHRAFLRNDGSYDMKPSPWMNTEFLKKKGVQLNDSFQKLACGLTVYPKEYFCPMDYETGEINITDKTYSIHHFHASWCTKEELKAHEMSQRLTKKYGKSVSYVVTHIYLFPFQIKSKFRQYGIFKTFLFILKKLIGSKANE